MNQVVFCSFSLLFPLRYLLFLLSNMHSVEISSATYYSSTSKKS